jgi:TonB family protein
MTLTPQGSSRTEERNRSYARTIERAFLVAAAFHLVGTLAVNPSLILGLFHPRTLLGYAGPSRPGELAPIGIPGHPGQTTFRLPRAAGPVTLVDLDVRGSSSGSRPARPSSRTKDAGEPVPEASSQVSQDSGGQGSGVRIELDENWSVMAGSGGADAVAMSGKFQVLKIVRPAYPRAAIRAGLEGLVQLEVRVDTAGTVVDVRTDVNTTANREMEEAATRAMLLWVFRPYREKAGPIPFTLIVPFRYRLVD